MACRRKGNIEGNMVLFLSTTGEYFFIDDDLKAYSQLKMDSTGRAILTMLRHCGRIREVRGNKLLRYVLKL